MGNGFFLGGAAQGLESLPQNIQRGAALGQQQEFQRGRLGQFDRALDLREQQAQQEQARGRRTQADSAVSDSLKFTGDVINRLKLAGKSPDEISAAIEPIVAQTESAVQAQGGDASRLRTRLEALITAPPVDEKGAVVAGGGQAAPGGPTKEMTTAQKNELGRAEAAVTSLTTEIDNFEELIQQEGANVLPFTAARDKATGARRNIQLQLKELFNLGVLNGPDLALMDQLIPDPTLSINPVEGAANVPINIQERSKAALAQLRQQIQTVLESKREAFTGQAPPPKPNNDVVLQEAKDAIARGASREAVAERLQLMGIDASGL